MRGTVIKFDSQRGFGFIKGADGLDYFVHFSDIVGTGYRVLTEGQLVTFDGSITDKGRRAVAVIPC